MVEQHPQGFEVEQRVSSSVDRYGPLSRSARPRHEVQPQRPEVTVLRFERIVVGQAAQPCFGQQKPVGPSFDETLHSRVHSTANSDG